MTSIHNELGWQMHSLRISIDDAVADCREHPDDLAFEELMDLLNRLYHYQEAVLAGWQKFDWAKAHELGWFSFNDYHRFQELEPWKAEVIAKWNKNLEKRDYKWPL